MRRAIVLPLLLVIVAGCGATQKARAYQTALAIEQINKQAATALDWDLIDADTGEYIQTGTRTATMDLKRVVADIKAGKKGEVVDRILDAIDYALKDLMAKLAKKGVK